MEDSESYIAGGSSDSGACALVVVPTHNEAANLDALITEVLHYLPGANILVVDDASCDGTSDIAAARAAHDPRVRLLKRPDKLGIGHAYIAGFGVGLKDDYQYFIQMDADFSHPPTELPQLLTKARDGVDVVVGSRYVTGADTSSWNEGRRYLSVLGNRLARVVLKIPIHDLTSGLRCVNRHTLQTVLDQLHNPGYAFQVEISLRAYVTGCTIEEIPIRFTTRRAGRSKLSITEPFKWLRAILRLRSTHRT